jgi:hypothetical protein
MILSPASDMPEDARTLARATLSELAGELDRGLLRRTVELDLYTKAHLLDSKERIAQALNAQLIQTAGTAR